eukprot:7166126-Heterocapsa_arctica.AAC.1
MGTVDHSPPAPGPPALSSASRRCRGRRLHSLVADSASTPFMILPSTRRRFPRSTGHGSCSWARRGPAPKRGSPSLASCTP